jgi:hypothetical protein
MAAYLKDDLVNLYFFLICFIDRGLLILSAIVFSILYLSLSLEISEFSVK